MTWPQNLRACLIGGNKRCIQNSRVGKWGRWPLACLSGLMLLLLRGEAFALAAGGSRSPERSPSSVSALSRPDPLSPVRLLMEQKFWEEARRDLQTLLEQPQTDVLEGSLLLAEVCYQTLDLPCTVSALGQARAHARSEDLEQVTALEKLVETRVGRVHLMLEPPGPVTLVREEPLLDLHLQRLVERTRQELQTLSRRRTVGPRAGPGREGLPPTRDEGGAGEGPRRVTRWLDPVTRAELSGPPPGQALLELWLPVGLYRVEGRPVTVAGGAIQPVLIRRAHAAPPPRSASMTLQGTYSAGAEAVGFLPNPGLELSLRGTRGWVGPLLALGVASHAAQPEVEGKGGIRPTVQLGVHGGISLGPWLRLEPELSGRVSVYPARRIRCAHDDSARTYSLAEGFCVTEGASTSALLGLTAVLQVWGWRITVEGQGGPQLLIPLEPGILGSKPEYRFDGLPHLTGLAQLAVGIGRWRTVDVLVENARRRKATSPVLPAGLVIHNSGGPR